MIFPRYCVSCKAFGDYICSDCFSKLSFRLDMKRGRGKIDGFFITLTTNRVALKLLDSFKKKYITSLSSVIGELMYESLIQNEEFNKVKNAVIIPMPLGKLSYRKRGFNEGLLLARELSRRLNIPLYDVLEYKKGRIVLVGKVSGNALLVEDRINLIREEEAARVLKEAGITKLYSISFIK